MDLLGMDLYGDSYEWGMKQLRDALDSHRLRDHKYLYYLIASKGDDASIARVVDFLRAASRNRSISPEFVRQALPDIASNDYPAFISLLLHYDLLVAINVEAGEYRLDHRLADILFHSGLHRPYAVTPSIILHSDPKQSKLPQIFPPRKPGTYWRSWINDAFTPGISIPHTEPPSDSTASVWARMLRRISRESTHHRPDLYGLEIDRATHTMDDVFNRLGPPPEPLGQDTGLPEPTPAGMS